VVSVEEDEDSPDRSEIHWEATFDAQGASEEDAKKKIAEIFEEGVAGMKKVAMPPVAKPLLMAAARNTEEDDK
jgi:hypothetical protein